MKRSDGTELRALRDRFAGLDAAVARAEAAAEAEARCVLQAVTLQSEGAYPAAGGKFFGAPPQVVTGLEKEGASPTFAAAAQPIYPYVPGAGAPAVGSRAVAGLVPYRWALLRRGAAAGKYCLTSAKFYTYWDVTGFTATFYDNWTSGTTVPATFEHQEVVGSLPYCYTPANPTHQYGILFSKPGWFDVIIRPGAVNSTTVNYTVDLAPLAIQATHDNGSGSMPYSGTMANPHIGTNLFPTYRGCFEFTAAETICLDPVTSDCPARVSGTVAFNLLMEHNTVPFCAHGIAAFFRVSQAAASQACFVNPGDSTKQAFLSLSHCSGQSVVSDCTGSLSGTSQFSPTQVNDTSSPFDVTLNWPPMSTCYSDFGTQTNLFATGSATFTW